MILTPRPYQTDCMSAFDDGYSRGGKRLAGVLPTGMGKTVIFAHMAKNNLARRPLILVHRDELIKQAADKVHSVAPDLSIGIIKASRNELGRDITIASVQTLSRITRLHSLSPAAFGFIIVDECHHAAAQSYLRILEYFGGFDENSETIVAGFTATMGRADNQGLGNVWQDVIFKRDILWGIHHNDNGPCMAGAGYLVDFRAKRVVVEGLDLGSVRKSRGDFSEGQLGEALSEAHIAHRMLENYLAYGEGRQGIAYLPTVQTATDVANVFNDAGIRVGLVTGATSIEDRTLMYKMVREKELALLINCMVLTEGFDLPQLSLIMIGRPTQSKELYVQMAGRGARPWMGKTDCLLMDFVGVSDDMRLASIVDLSMRQIHPKEGESLAEADEREWGDEGTRIEGTGRTISVHDVDLFASRSAAWLRTKRGYWFIPAGNRVYCMLPEDTGEQTFIVGHFWTGVGSKEPNGKIATGQTLEYGMAWAESEAEAHDMTVARRGASWRKKKEAPSSGQLKMAETLHIEIPERVTKAKLSDLISTVMASRILDRWQPPELREDD